MKSQVSQLCQTGYYHLHRIRSIRDCLTQHASELLVHSLVISRHDYGNSLLYGLLDQLLDKLQRAQNAAVRVVVKASRDDHVTPIVGTLLAPSAISYSIQYTTNKVQSQSSTCAQLPHISARVLPPKQNFAIFIRVSIGSRTTQGTSPPVR